MATFSPKNIVLAGLGAIAFGFLYGIGASLYGLTEGAVVELNSQSVVSILVIVCGIIGVAYGGFALSKQRRILQPPERSTSIILGGKQFDLGRLYTRSELGRTVFDALVPSAKEKIILFAISFDSVGGIIESLTERLSKGISVEFLALSPKNPDSTERSDMVGEVEKSQTVQALDQRITSNLETVCSLKTKYPSLVTIKTYDWIPYHGAIIIDPASSDGMMQVAFYLYKVDAPQRPNAILAKKQELFGKVLQSYNEIWSVASNYKCGNATLTGEEQARQLKQQVKELKPTMKRLRVQLEQIDKLSETTSPPIQHEIVGIERLHAQMCKDSLDLVLAKNSPEIKLSLDKISSKIELAERTVQPDPSIQYDGDYYKEVGVILSRQNFLKDDRRSLYALVMGWLRNNA